MSCGTHALELIKESSNELGGGRIQRLILIPGMSPEQSRPRTVLHDLLHGRQACAKLNSFHQGLFKYVPEMVFFRAAPSYNGEKKSASPPHSLNGSKEKGVGGVLRLLARTPDERAIDCKWLISRAEMARFFSGRFMGASILTAIESSIAYLSCWLRATKNPCFIAGGQLLP